MHLVDTLAPTSTPALSRLDPLLMANAPSTNVYIHCRVSQAMSASLQSIAKKEDRSVSYIMRQAFKEYLASRSIDAPLI